MAADLSNDEIIDFCASLESVHIIGGHPHGNLVLRLPDGKAVKFGKGVTRDEAENQRLAYHLADPQIVLIPRVHRFFQDEHGLGYLVMDYVNGHAIETLEDRGIKKVASILDYLASIRSIIPGSLSGGPSRGIIFPDTEDLFFDDTQSIEIWLNSKLFDGQPKVSLQHCELVFCHLDITPRNILWADNGDVYLIDWASAGFYPRIFEFCVQWIAGGKDGDFNRLILESTIPLSDQELSQKEPLLLAWKNMQRYSFSKTILEPSQDLLFPPNASEDQWEGSHEHSLRTAEHATNF